MMVVEEGTVLFYKSFSFCKQSRTVQRLQIHDVQLHYLLKMLRFDVSQMLNVYNWGKRNHYLFYFHNNMFAMLCVIGVQDYTKYTRYTVVQLIRWFSWTQYITWSNFPINKQNTKMGKEYSKRSINLLQRHLTLLRKKMIIK